MRAHIAAPAVATRGLCSESLTLRVTTRLDALYDHLLAAGLSSASELLFGGCSAGGLTVYMHADYVASRMPPSVKMAALADAMFSVYSTDVKGQLSYPERMGWIFKAMNSSASVNQACLACIPHLNPRNHVVGGWGIGNGAVAAIRIPTILVLTASVNQACLAANPGNGTVCMMGANTAPYVKTPLFVLNSK